MVNFSPHTEAAAMFKLHTEAAAMFKLKAIAPVSSNAGQMKDSIIDRVKSSVEKGESYQHFFLSSQCFQKPDS